MKTNSLTGLGGWMALVLLAGLMVSYLASYQQGKAIDRHVQDALRDAGEGIGDSLQARLRVYEYRLRGLRGAIHMLDLSYISISQMSRYSQGRNIEKEYPGARGFGFIRRVAIADEADFLRRVRSDGKPEFTLSRLSVNQGDRYIIQFIDPPARNAQAVGLDIASEPRRREAAVQAMRSGAATLSAPITLQQSSEERLRAFLFLLPVYNTPETPTDTTQRETNLIGWTYAPLTMLEVMSSLDPANHRLHLRLYDVSDTRQLIYQTPENGPDPEVLHVHTFEREIYGRIWRMEVGAHPQFVEALDPVSPSRVFVIGVLASLLLTTMVGTLLLSRQRQQEVIAGQARLATIVENSSDAIIGEALNGRIITWNRAAEQMFGYAEHEVLGRPLAPLLVPLQRIHEDEQLLERVARGERGPTLETQRLHKDSRLIDVTITGSLIREADGSILGAAKMMHDITDRKRVERYLMEFNAQLEQQVSERTAELSRVAGLLQAVLDASSEVSIIATDTDGQIVVFNRGAEILLGYSHAEMVRRKTPMDFHLPEEVDLRSAELSREYGIPIEGIDVFCYKAALEGAETRQWTYVRKDASRVPISMVITPIRTTDGELIGHLGIAQDITERLRHSADMQAAKASAEAANAAKSLFLANMSHEIRTPMNAVIGIAHLLQNSSLNEQQRQLLTKLQIAGRTLLGIINDILDIAKIEAGEMRLENKPFSPRQLLAELGELFAAQAQQKGLRFAVNGAMQMPDLLIGDALRVNQILMNLVGNALKFTTEGGVEVSVSHQEQSAERCWLRFSVQDSGCGIAAEVLDRLFSPFTQADASTTRRFGGTGLGLSVVRGLVDQMGGQLGVRSEPGMGSDFWVALPFQLCPGELEPSALGSSLEVLVLSDESGVPNLQRLCRGLGWRVANCADLQALCLIVQERQQTGSPLPDLLLVDWQRPALQDLHRLREVTRLPVILVTGPVEGVQPSWPVDNVLFKPLDSSALFNAVNACIARYHGSTERVLHTTRLDTAMTRWLSGLHLLLVDDSEINLEVASLLLQQQGASVQTCATGLQALERLRQAPALFDAVLMDVQMPEMDGYEATRRLRTELGLTLLPVLALTAGALAEERRQAELAGMDDFLTKPLEPTALIRAIRRAVERVRGSPLAVSNIASTQALDAEDWPLIEGIDVREAAGRFGHDKALYLSSLRRFFSEFGTFAEADAVVRRTDLPCDPLIAELHKLRGVASLLGAQALAQLAGQAETMLCNGGDARQTLGKLSEAFVALQQQAASIQASTAPVPCADTDPTTARQALASLHRLLENHDIDALNHFALAAPALQAAAGQVLVEQLWQAIEGLEFERALQLLERADL
ncbi:CHASE domain-containing protein [Pseudomonas sp. StFLB209]|uniref:CHASE domain-containing protein n=1 Tax=Pseudomonas sp. StFLB209 TaxID=1028989 RepID=UPI001568B479|nr:CHASE domain-containing protein [Pseudomonas sp. StFLB209]